ncbi:MAG: hypothetical protein GXP25_17750 [Planctomycetes bacterium]|nr:hypothetical protein [Planctomycetota bacterium]
MKICSVGAVVLLVCLVGTVDAFNGHTTTEGPLTLTIGEVEEVTEYDTPQEVDVSLKNNSDFPLKIQLQMRGLVDEWRAVGNVEATVDLKPNEESKTTFSIAAGEGACSALYPVHVYAHFQYDGKKVTAHAVQIFKSSFARDVASSAKPGKLQVNVVPSHGALPLYPLRTQRVAWCYYDKPLVYMPIGWQGSAPKSRANFARRPLTRGATKPAIQMHPPWQPGGGTIFVEYRVKLPEEKPIKLLFANAIRDSAPTEPKSDGVTFRVWAGDKKLFERHTDSKIWLDGEADLSKFAGKEILLRLESHPGPKRNTTCDSSYWGEPVVVAGEPPPQLTEGERAKLCDRARKAIAAREGANKDELVFKLDDGYTAAIVLGKNGLADAAIAFGKGDRSVVFDGLRVSVLQHKVGQWPSQIALREVKIEKDWLFGKTKIKHRVQLGDDQFDVTAEVWKEKAGLRIKVTSPKRITDLALGPADRKAPRVYYGHGYCIIEPQAFSAGFGGHNLATSHVGFEFDNGVSLLTACDSPPDRLEVNPEQKIYALHTHMNSMLTLVPSMKGAFDCAIKYRPLYDKKPAGGVKRAAGRFVFDIWGGRYADTADRMQRMIDYGLTDSLLTVHNWQRWGYDYRLPDIYPPNPKFGTVEDMQKIAAVCKRRDIPWGLHDNYIDFYPDAEDYSYNDICFTESGHPIKAWINRSRDAQSYRWRPDRIMPFVKRNLKLIKPNLHPTHYFIDVFTSARCFDFYDREGHFHPSTETRKCWGEAFAWIRNTLGGNAPTTSEAGHDQLIGYLDGADCQQLQLTNGTRPKGKRHWFYIRLLHKDWERVPWFDAVLHDKFILHGVGYSNRYQGGRSRRDHGIESDDYISAEILFGHALMIDRGAFGPGAVRKYWLAQDFIRSVALDEIVDVEFVGGDIHRQIVTWKSGAVVYVNRSEKDWKVAGKMLPQYGYYAKNGEIESSIERIGGVIVEQSRGPSRGYVNGRGFDTDTRLRLRPVADRVEYLDGRKFKLLVNWQADRPAPKDLHIFVHFDSPKAESKDKIAFQGGGKPKHGTSTWKGRITTGTERIIEIPEAEGAGEYEATIGLWDPSFGRRYGLLGDDTGGMRYRLGKLIVEGKGKKITNIRLVKHEPKPEPPSRRNVDKRPIDFGPVVTCGALRCEVEGGTITVTPLPDMEPFDVTLKLDKLTGRKRVRVESVAAVNVSGKQIRAIRPPQAGTALTFRTAKDDFAYRIVLLEN